MSEILAPEILSVNLMQIQKNPVLDLKGDLAERSNRNIFNSNMRNASKEETIPKEEPLIRAEEVCCYTFTQWMPNLNQLCNSTRLKRLIEEDLYFRKKGNKPKSKKN